jgi:ribosomal protein S18 acetylase RimI-like enzyme
MPTVAEPTPSATSSSAAVITYVTPLPSDAGALSSFFGGLLPLTYPLEFFREAATAPTFFSRVAVCGGRVVGAIVMKSWDLAAASGPGKQLPFDLLARPEPGDAVAGVLLLAVGPTFRRLGVGSQLLQEGLGAAAGATPRLRAVFLMHRAADEAARAFYCGGCALPFAEVGRWPGHYELPGGAREDASVVAMALHGAELAEFEGAAGGGAVNLLDPALKRKRRMPAWQRDLLLFYVLPFCAVALLFAVSYALVALGPLRGISGPPTGRGAPPPLQQQQPPHPTAFAARRGGPGSEL